MTEVDSTAGNKESTASFWQANFPVPWTWVAPLVSQYPNFFTASRGEGVSGWKLNNFNLSPFTLSLSKGQLRTFARSLSGYDFKGIVLRLDGEVNRRDKGRREGSPGSMGVIRSSFTR